MSETLVLGLQGFATAGKDETADRLVAKYGFTKLSFSDALNDCLMALNPLIGYHGDTGRPMRYAEHVERWGYTDAKRHPEVRALLQRMGTEVGRNILGQDTWVDIVRRRIEAQPGRYVIVNVRFTNELAMIYKFQYGFVIEVDRPGVGPVNDHPSENLPEPWPWAVVRNNGTLADLDQKVDDLAEMLLLHVNGP